MAFLAIRTPATSRLFRGTRQLHFRPLHFLTSRTSKRLGNGQEVVFNNVKVKQRRYGSWKLGPLRSRTALSIFATVLAFEIYDHLVISPLGKAVSDLAQISPHEEEEDDDSDFFFPLPLTTREVIPPPYSREDPEWAEFVKISKDKDYIRHMRTSLVSQVLRITSGHSILTARFGKPLRVSSWHLDLDYPLYPPPVHRQFGILITDEVVAIAERERDSQAARFEERVLWPKPVMMATWAVLSAIMSQSRDLIIGTLFGGDGLRALDQPGLGSDPPPAIASATTKPNDVQKAMQAIREHATRRPGEVPPHDSSMASSGDKAPSKAASPGPVNGSGLPTSSPKAKDDKADEAPRELSYQTKIFWRAYSKAYRPSKANPPRGSVPVMGVVVVETPKAWLYIDVIGWWDPKEKDYHSDSLAMHLGRVRSKVINPLR
ncbi:hypothetical protein V8F06_009185 [Rhypophila decipiens]